MSLVGLVSSPEGRRCSYFVDDPEQVDLATQARQLGVPGFRPRNVNDPELLGELAKLAPDYFIVGNYQQILKPSLLAVPTVTSINFHPSPLPRYAGLAPFFWMAKHGERHSGVTALEVTPGIDDGPIVMQRPVELSGTETALDIRMSHEQENVDMLAQLIPRLASHSYETVPQDLRMRSYFGRPSDDDYLIDFAGPAENALRTIRAGYRSPGAYARTDDGERVVILSARLSETPGNGHPREPGVVRHSDEGVLVGTPDGWLRLLSVDSGGQEVPARMAAPVLKDGTRLAAADEILGGRRSP